MDSSSTGAALGTGLIEQLADFFRASALYPPTNARVQRAATSAIEIAASVCENLPCAKVRVTHDGFTVNGQPIQSDKANAEWLADSMRETALGGIDLSPAMTIDALLDFAKKLRENAGPAKRALTFSSMWSEPFAGITPVERLFILSSAEWNQLPDELRGILDEDSPRGARLREMLETSAPVIEQVTDLVERSGSEQGEMMVGGAVDLLRRILDALPPEFVEDPTKCMRVVQRILSTGASTLDALADDDTDRATNQLRRMVIEVSSRYFARPDGRSEGDELDDIDRTPAGPQGHPGDEKISNDAAALLQEYETLPDGDEVTLDETSVDSPRERLGIYLHLLLQVRHASDAQQLEEPISDALAAMPSPDEGLLQPYFDRLRGRAERLPWLAGFLLRAGLLRLAIDCGMMQPQTMVSMFPAAFGPYLDVLRDEDEALEAYLDGLETERVLEARDELIGADGTLTTERVEKLMKSHSPHALPFVHLAISEGVLSVRAVIDYLHRLKLTSPESAALRVLEAERLPLRYVRKLCTHEVGLGDDTSALARESEALLRAFIEDDREDVDIKRQVRAIGALDSFWSSRVEEYVQNLARGEGLLRLRRRPKHLRDAARALLSTRGRKS